MASEAEVLARVTALLAADPVCMGKVNKATVRQIAQIVAFPEAVADGDVLAERAACRGLLARAGVRLLDLVEASEGGAVSSEDVSHEVVRIDEAVRAIGIGLHRANVS